MKAKVEVVNDLKILSETLEEALLGSVQERDPDRFPVLVLAAKDIAVIAQGLSKDDVSEDHWKGLHDFIRVLDLACKVNSEIWAVILYSLVTLACKEPDVFKMFKGKLVEAVHLSMESWCDCENCKAKRESK